MGSKSDLISLTNYQENLLQTYRNIFISSQTVVISIASLIVAISEGKSLIFPLIVIGMFLLFFWHIITRDRGYDVSYFHMQLEKKERKTITSKEDNEPFLCFKQWQKNSPENKESILNEFDEDLLKSRTRRWMGIYLPLIYFLMWLIIGFIALTSPN